MTIDRGLAWAALTAAAFGLLLTAIRAQPPLPGDAGDDRAFSAVAARGVLEELYDGIGIHPIGTEANRRLRDRILRHLRQLGYEPSVQSTMACWEAGGCGQVDNILARLAGTGSGKAVLLAVHYDGVGAGPSISDDGVAVAAALEIARQLQAGPPLTNDVIFLIDDGEEAFLLGAVAFAAKHPWATDVGAVVNLEARGSSGRSYMFETGTDNAWLIDLMRQAVPRPATSSLFYSVYQRLPNDTDFTVFKHYGMNGVNFAFIQDVVHYHTPRDDLDHASSASLQHHGENALAMVRALGNADLDDPPAGTASWFDLWGFTIVSWPEPANLPLSVLSMLLLAAIVGGLLRRRVLTARQLSGGLLALPLSLLGGTLPATLATWILRGPGRLPDWPAIAWVPRTAFWLIGFASAALVVGYFVRRSGGLAIWLGTLLWSGALAALLSGVLPGAAYLFLAPALVGATLSAGAALLRARAARLLAVAATVLATGAAQLILAWSLWDAMGLLIMPVVTLLVAAFSTVSLVPLAAVASRWNHRLPWAGVTLSAALVALALVLPAYSEESPRALNLYFVQDGDSGSAKVALRPGRRALPAALGEALDWQVGAGSLFPWDDIDPGIRIAPAEPLPLAPPGVEVLQTLQSGSGRRVRARFTSPRGAERGALVFPQTERIESLELVGWEFDLQTEEVRSWYPDGNRVVRFATVPVGGIEFAIEITGLEPFPVHVVDASYGLPVAADPLTAVRTGDLVPIGRGDQTYLHTRAEL